MESRLQYYLEYLRAKREAVEEINKRFGLNWETLKTLEADAVAEFLSTQKDPIQIGRYKAVLEPKEIRMHKGVGEVIDTKFSIKLHT